MYHDQCSSLLFRLRLVTVFMGVYVRSPRSTKIQMDLISPDPGKHPRDLMNLSYGPKIEDTRDGKRKETGMRVRERERETSVWNSFLQG